MTSVVEQTPFKEYTANGATTVFAYDFQVLQAADMVVYANGVVVPSSEYVLSGIGVQAGGSVTFTVAPANLVVILLNREISLSRTTEYQTLGDFKAAVVNPDFNRLWMALQGFDAVQGGAVRAPYPEQMTGLPTAAARADRTLGFDSLGQPTVLTPVSGSAASVLTDLANTASATLGDALVGQGAIISIIDGDLTRYATLAAAVTAIGATACTLLIRDSIAMGASSTIPATCVLRIENAAQITTTGFTLTINGPFSADVNQCFAGTGTVKFGKGAVSWICPQWFGAKGDGVVADGSGTDSTDAFLKAVAASCEDGVSDVAIHSIYTGAGNYVVGALSFPPAFRMFGAGRQITNFVAKTGTTGVWFGDSGSAAKIVLEGFAMYARSLAGITYGIRLGYGATQHGVEGHCRDLFVRDVKGASAILGFDANGNVAYYENIASYDCTSGIRIVGVANIASSLVAYAPTVTGVEVNLCDIDGVEVEAPGNSCVPVKLSGNADLRGLIVSLANSTTISHLVQIEAAATNWAVSPLNLAFGSTPAGVTVSNGNFKRSSDSTYFGGNATAGNRAGEGHYSSEYAGQRPQCFTLSITNTGGTLQHKITEPGVNGATNWAGLINGSSATLANTPTGADGSTAMVSGGKIGSASTNVFWLDTANQRAADSQFMAVVQFNSAGTDVTVTPGIVSLNINGVTRTRLSFQFNNSTTGAAFALTTANIAAGKFIQVLFNGVLS